MNNPYNFLGPSESDLYIQPDRKIDRYIIKDPSEQQDSLSTKEQNLSSYFDGELKVLTKAEYRWFKCRFIQVLEGDGSSWSSQMVNDKVKNHLSHFNRFCLADQINFGKLPLIADFIGRKFFLKAAVDNKLTTSFIGLKNWFTPMIILVAVIIGIGLKALEIILKYKTEALKNQPAEILFDPMFIGITTSLIFLGLVSKQISIYLSTKTESKSIDNFKEQLENEQVRKTNFDKFINKLARKLVTKEFPRFVIIDNFGRLDEITRTVILKYFQNYARHRVGSEYWVVFETEGYERLSSRLDAGSCTYAIGRSEQFRQRLLNTDEKQKLITSLGLADNPEDFISVKDLCKGNEQTRQSLNELFQNYRSLNPKQGNRYGSIDFLYLISLTAYPGKTPLDERFLIDKLSVKSGLDSFLLDKLLVGTRRQKIEFKKMLASIRKDFDYRIILEDKDDPYRLTLTSEIARFLETNANSLDLPPAGLGHLFWSLFWYNKFRNAPVQAFFIRKLAYHISKIDLMGLEKDDQLRKIVRDIFEAHLFIIDGAMKICLFEIIPALIQNVVYLMDDDNYEPMDSDRKRLYERAWEAYLTLGEENILELILDIFQFAPASTRLPVEAESNPLDVLYFESTIMNDVKRATLANSYDNATFGNPNSLAAISNYAKSRSGWFATTLLHMTDRLDRFKSMNIVQASIEVLRSFYKLNERCQSRVLNGVSNHRRVIDILSLSLLQWSSGLSTKMILNLSAKENINLQEHINRLVDSAENMVILANELKTRDDNQKTNTEFDYLLSVLLQDICLVSISSILIAERSLEDYNIIIFNNEIFGKIDRVINDINSLFDFEIPGLDKLQDLRSSILCEKIDSLLKLCCIIYRRFKLTLLHDFLELRRLQFTRICLGVNLSASERIRNFSDSLSTMVDKRDYTGIIANFVLANTLHEAIELRAHYVQNGCKLAIESKCGDVLKRELSIVAISETHSLNTDPLIFIEHIFDSSTVKNNFLDNLLDEVLEKDFNSIILCFLNTVDKTTSEKARADLYNVIEKKVQNLSPSDLKKDLSALIDYFKFKKVVRSGDKLDVGGIIKEWEDRKHLWMYIGVINLILENGYSFDKIADEVFSALNHDPIIDNINVNFLLALNTVGKLAHSKIYDERFKIALEYLRKSMPMWKKHSTVETNLRAYKMLCEVDAQNKDVYLNEIMHWQVVKIERDHLRRLPIMAAQGKYFLIFYDYFESMVFWGLGTEIPFNDLYNKLNISPKNKIEYLSEWKVSDAEVPNPWVINNNQRCLSSEFLSIGHFLFNPPVSIDSQFNDDRQRVNMIAKKHLKELINLICNLPKLPFSIRILIERFSKRYQNFQLPEN